MIDSRLQWLCEVRDFQRFVELLGYIEHPDGGRSIIKPMALNLERKEPHLYIEEGSLRLDYSSAQSMMTAFWQAGIRPHGLKATDSEVKRLENHLEDMRRLVFESSPSTRKA